MVRKAKRSGGCVGVKPKPVKEKPKKRPPGQNP